MASTLHTHGNAAPHEHEGATPGHTHDDYGERAPAPVAEATHSHPGLGSHAHADATPGHTHDVDRTVERPASVAVGPSAGGLTGRILLTLLGAAGLIISAFLNWFSFAEGEVPPGIGTEGTNTAFSVFYSTELPFPADLITSVGMAAIVLGVLALLGLAFRGGWLTTLAGVLGIVAFAAIVITLYRVPDAGLGLGNVGIGLWIMLAGAVVALIGGFFGARPRVRVEPA